MHIGGALVLHPLPGGGTPAIGVVREHLERRAWTCCPATGRSSDAPRTGGLSWPSWEADQRFELEAHVRHATLPPPGEESDFLEWISDFYSHRLDRSRPLMGDRAARRPGGWPLGVGAQDPPLPGRRRRLGRRRRATARRRARAARSSAPHSRACVGLRRRIARMALHLSAPVGLLTGAGLAAARAGRTR